MHIYMNKSLFYKTEIGKFQNIEEIKIIDEIRQTILDDYANKLKERSSLHEYIINAPLKLQHLVNKIRNSKQIKNSICSQYEICDLIPIHEIDELYISHYNMDGGGDQGLYDKHYDGVLRIMNDATVIRALIYVNSNDDFVVHFLDSDKSHNFSNYEYGILDFNREYHWVEGKYDENMDYKNSRILLKLNYLICPKCSPIYTKFIILLNYLVFCIVKICMEYSKSPQTPFQYFIGFFCNLFRVVNNVSVYLTFLLIIILTLIVCLIFYNIIKIIKNLKLKNLKLKKLHK